MSVPEVPLNQDDHQVPLADQVTLGNWQEPPYNRWAFSHMDALVPIQPIAAGLISAPMSTNATPLGSLLVHATSGADTTINGIFGDTYTDAVVVVHNGQIVYERYFGETNMATPHLLMSVSKSVVGCIAGILIDRGHISADEHITTYVPELIDSGYIGATVRNLLDMRTGVRFSEEYTNPEAEVRVMEEAMGWSPASDRDVPKSMYAYLTQLGRSGEHGGLFQYRSADTDVLGWVCERVMETGMADLISSLIWVPLGAEYPAGITCDSVGSPIHDGGMCCTARDLARFGVMLLNNGKVGDFQVVPEEWIRSAWTLDPDIRDAFERSEAGPFLPGGWYRNKFWFMPREHADALLCLGIYGQMVYVNRGTGTVAAKLSSWPTAQSFTMLHDTLRAFDAAAANLAGLTPEGTNRESPPGIAVGLSR